MASFIAIEEKLKIKTFINNVEKGGKFLKSQSALEIYLHKNKYTLPKLNRKSMNTVDTSWINNCFEPNFCYSIL